MTNDENIAGHEETTVNRPFGTSDFVIPSSFEVRHSPFLPSHVPLPAPVLLTT